MPDKDEFSQAYDEAIAKQGGSTAPNWKPNPNDLRPDGTPKGNGWLGVLPVKYPDGGTGVATEYSVGIGLAGKNVIIPSLVPTLTPEEQQLMLSDIIPNHKPVPPNIMQKAVGHAKERIKLGLSPFKD
jgi:hypothetical protein